MAEPRDHPVDTPVPGETRDAEPESSVRSSDRERHNKRSRAESPDNRSRDSAVGRENVEDVDPDSAQSDIDRDDTDVD
jgi:hypothetical protein